MIHFTLGALADYAADTGNGKVTLVGIFQQITVDHGVSPIPLPECALAFIGTASLIDGTKHDAELTLEDQDNVPLRTFRIPVAFAAAGPGYPARVQLIVNLRGLNVPGVGDYHFRLRVSGKSYVEVPFVVVGRPQSSAPAPGS